MDDSQLGKPIEDPIHGYPVDVMILAYSGKHFTVRESMFRIE